MVLFFRGLVLGCFPGWRGVTHCKMVYGDAQRLKGGFSSFLVYRWVGFRSRPNPPNLQNWVYFGKFGQKSTQFAPNWVFFATNWYSDGSQNHAFRGIEMVDFPKSTLSIPVQIFLKNAPPRSEYRNSDSRVEQLCTIKCIQNTS